jgi:hypothetical protein
LNGVPTKGVGGKAWRPAPAAVFDRYRRFMAPLCWQRHIRNRDSGWPFVPKLNDSATPVHGTKLAITRGRPFNYFQGDNPRTFVPE